MPAKPAGLKPGLRGRYFAGTWFEKQITERVDRTIDFEGIERWMFSSGDTALSNSSIGWSVIYIDMRNENI